jgi:hypothetical protein
MQNKANLLESQMNVSPVITREYENKSNWTLGENKPNTNPIRTQSNPIKPNFKGKKMLNLKFRHFSRKTRARDPGS